MAHVRVLRQNRDHRPQLVLAYPLNVLVRLVNGHLKLLADLNGLLELLQIVVVVLPHRCLQLFYQNFDHPIALFIACRVFYHAAGDVRQLISWPRL